MLVDIEQITGPEASAILGINPNTAYTRLHAAQLRFQQAVNRLRSSEQRHEGGGS